MMDHLSIRGANQQQIHQYQNSNDLKDNVYVKITEQPTQKALRFRYESEGRFTGPIPGNQSNTRRKTYPSIQVVGYVGKAHVVVSCVTKDSPYRSHPHHVVGKTECNGGVYRQDIPPDTMSITFSNISIRCVKRNEIAESLRLRKLAMVDPFPTEVDSNEDTPIDLNVVRLCFQVILETDNKNIPLTPVVSDCIYNKKGQSDLTIDALSDRTSDVDGGKKDIILLCEKVDKDNIQIRFYEEKNNQIVWDYLYDVYPAQVHRQVAIIFRTPPYHRLDVTEPVDINIQLRRPSDGAAGDPVPFQLLPLKTIEATPLSSASTSLPSTPLTSGMKRKATEEQGPAKKAVKSDSRCLICNLDVPKASFSSHIRSRKHNQACIDGKGGIEVIKHALNTQLTTFRIPVDGVALDTEVLLQHILPKALHTTGKNMEQLGSLNVSLELFGLYHQPTQRLEDIKSFNTQAIPITTPEESAEVVTRLADVMKTKAIEFQHHESGWVLQKWLWLEVIVAQCSPLVDNSYTELPKSIMTKKACLNI